MNNLALAVVKSNFDMLDESMLSRKLGIPCSVASFYLILLISSLTTLYVTLTLPTGLIRSTTFRIQQVLPRAPLPTTGKLTCDCRDYDHGNDLASLDENITSSNHSNQATSSLHSESHLLIPKDERKVKSVSMLGNLWNFQDIGDQLLFIYEQFLTKNSNANHMNTAIFRQDLAEYRTELNDSSRVVLHQENCQVNGSSKKLMKTSPELFKVLPKRDPIGLSRGKRFHSCAVVGNSGSILHSGCGKQIDKHDFVIRCNLAPLEPFKEDAGMRSDYITMNPTIIIRKYGTLRKAEAVKRFNQDLSQYAGILSIPCFGIGQSISIKTMNAYKGKKPIIVCMNGKHFQSVSNFWKKRKAITKKPSTGFYLVSMAFQICDEVDLYGFWPFSSRFGYNKTDIPYHYFDNMTSSKADQSHEMNKEFSILAQLHGLGVVKLNVGSCSAPLT